MNIVLLHYYSVTANPAYDQIARAMRQQGHSVIIGSRQTNHDLAFHDGESVRCTAPGPKTSPASNALLSSLLNKLLFLSFVLRLRKQLRQLQPDIVQINKAGIPWYWLIPLLMPSNIAFILDCRQVFTLYDSPSRLQTLKQRLRFAIHRLIIRWCFTKATYLHQRGALYELGNQWQRHGIVVPLGVGKSFLDHHNADEDDKTDPFSFLYIGSITRIRKLDLLMEAAALQKKATGPHFKLVFAGPDNTEGYYQDRAKALDAEDVIEFLGPVQYDDIPTLICRHHVALAYVPYIPRDWAYQPTLKILEYLALGVPVLATDVAPNEDIIAEAGNGMIVRNQAEDWQRGMHQYLTDDTVYRQALQQARKCRSGHSWNDIAALYVQQYSALLKK